MLVFAFIIAYPMVADILMIDLMSFYAVLEPFGFTILDEIGALLMIFPFHIVGVISLYMWSKNVSDRLTEFLELFCEKLGSLVSSGKMASRQVLLGFS